MRRKCGRGRGKSGEGGRGKMRVRGGRGGICGRKEGEEPEGSLVRGGEGGRREECEGLELRGVLVRDVWEEVVGAAWRRWGHVEVG